MYGLIGKKLGHSFSADFFNNKFKMEKSEECYRLFPLETISQLPQLLKNNPELKGLNVTIPYKELVIPYLDEVSEEIEKIGAVNVIKITRNNNKTFLKGYNTDIYGFRMSLLPLLTNEIKKALILGTGGASKAVEYVLFSQGIEFIKISRKPKDDNLIYSDLNQKIIKDHQLIINTTPLGMFPDIDVCPDIPYQYLDNKHICFDLVYNPEETLFLKKAKENGAVTKNGLEMLHLQALAAWEIWKSTI